MTLIVEIHDEIIRLLVVRIQSGGNGGELHEMVSEQVA